MSGSISINDVSITEGHSGTLLLTFTVTRTGGGSPAGPPGAFSVNWGTADNTATLADSDYQTAFGTLNFGVGVTTQTISIAINGDTQVEADETMYVVLSAATNGATISDNLGQGTIV